MYQKQDNDSKIFDINKSNIVQNYCLNVTPSNIDILPLMGIFEKIVSFWVIDINQN